MDNLMIDLINELPMRGGAHALFTAGDLGVLWRHAQCKPTLRTTQPLG